MARRHQRDQRRKSSYKVCIFWTAFIVAVLVIKLTWMGDVIKQHVISRIYSVHDLYASDLERCYCGRNIDFTHDWPPHNRCSLQYTTHRGDAHNVTTFKVPNIVHYTWFTDTTKAFEFHHMLSVLSVDKYLKPDAIYLHTNKPPVGEYWTKSAAVRNFKVVYRKPRNVVWDVRIRKPPYETSTSNVERLKILSEYGGIYMDLDYIALKSFDALRHHPCTIGTEYHGRVCGGLIICAKNSPFLYFWLKSYIDDYRRVWAHNTGIVPVRLARKCPHIIHIEHESLHHPNYLDHELSELLVKSTWWKRQHSSYGVHLWYRKWKGFEKRHDVTVSSMRQNLSSIRQLRNPYGEIARTILFGFPHTLDGR